MGFQQTLLVKGGSASKFTELTDTFPNYTGKAGQVVAVKGDETGLTSVPMSGVSFAKLGVHLNSTFSSVVGFQKIPLDAVDYDTANIWDSVNKRAIPKLAGYYQVFGRARSGTGSQKVLEASLNSGSPGSLAIGGNPTNALAVGGGTLIYCNGTTDYLELYIYDSASTSYTTGIFDTYLKILGPF